MEKEIIITRKINTENLQGSIKVKTLTYEARIAYSKEAMVEVKPSEGESLETFEAKASLDRAKAYEELATRQCSDISVKIISDDVEMTATTISELMVFQEGQELVMDIAMSLIQGIQLGKKKS